MENSESLQILVELLKQGGLIVLFYSVLWTLGTRDRKCILSLLHKVIHLLEVNGNGEVKSIRKGGGSDECYDRKGNVEG